MHRYFSSINEKRARRCFALMLLGVFLNSDRCCAERPTRLPPVANHTAASAEPAQVFHDPKDSVKDANPRLSANELVDEILAHWDAQYSPNTMLTPHHAEAARARPVRLPLVSGNSTNATQSVAIRSASHKHLHTGLQHGDSGGSPWWTERVSTPLRAGDSTLPIDLDTLFALTAAYSGRVQAIAQTPWINQAKLQQAQAAFDPTLFNDARFDSTSDPVGNTLTTGGPPRLEEDTVSVDAGVQGTRQSGTTYRIGQRVGHQNSNSTFFIPNNQGTARLYANLTKPLLRGRKVDVNRTLVLTGRFETRVAQAAYQEAIQEQLFEVADKYWSLYVERASRLQRIRHLERATELADYLENRAAHDGVQSQILRARAAVTNRTAELAQVDARIRNLESTLRSLVNAPELIGDRDVELLPIQAALLLPVEFAIEDETAIALQRRPEIAELKNKAQIVNARLVLARDQTKPTLNLVAEGYVAGLNGSSDVGKAFVKQFDEGRPGYAAGLSYELPIGRRLATATVRQRQHELAQLNHLMRETTETIRTEVESAIRTLYASREAAVGRQAALAAVVSEVEYLQDRWKTLGNDARLGQLQVSELLASQDRLLQEEQNLLQALVQYNRAILDVQRSTGGLIRITQ